MDESTHPQGERLQSEASFHDARVLVEDEHRLGYAYASVGDVYEFGAIPPDRWNAAVLEIGCFRGDHAARLRGFSGSYTGIDISPEAIAHCRDLDLPKNFQFRLDDANCLDTIPDQSVDYAYGFGVLHHLQLPSFAAALENKLTPTGYARFVEPAQGNVLIRTFRKLTPKLRTPDEYPFDDQSIETLQRHFDVRVTYQALLRPLLPMLAMNHQVAVKVSRWLDDRLLTLPAMQRQAWLLQIELRKRNARGEEPRAQVTRSG